MTPAVAVAVAVLAFVWGTPPAWGHAALLRTEPAADAALDVAPTAVRLSFTEQPEVSLSSVRVFDAAGTSYVEGDVRADVADPLSLAVALKPLGAGVYTVSWRVVSAVDGHPTAGAYAFGVGASPLGAAPPTEGGGGSPVSRQELVARWLFLVGLVLALGAATATALGFAGPGGATTSGAVGWFLSAVGVVLLAEAQRRNAGATLGALWGTAVGRALAWRAAAVAVAGVAFLVGGRRRTAAGAAAIAITIAMAVHVAAGHAAGGTGAPWRDIVGQWAHVVAAGVWVGGLAALLSGIRGAPSEDKAFAVRRFSAAAAAALVLVAATGTVRAVDEVPEWGDLADTAYGRAVVAKVVLLLGMAALGAWNRWRSVPQAAQSLGGLRRRSSVELGLGAAALVAASLLATVAPPAGQAQEAVALRTEGTDFGGTVHVGLAVQPGAPGRNRFAVHLSAAADRVTLRLRPSDDPGVAPSTLELRAEGGAWVGEGSQLAFDGRWGIEALVERGSGSAAVPLELHVRGAPQFLSVERIPGRPVRYTVEVAPGVYARIFVENGSAHVDFFDDFGTERPVDSAVVTTTAQGRTRQHLTRRMGPGRFAVDIGRPPGPSSVAVVARAPDGARLRAAVDLD